MSIYLIIAMALFGAAAAVMVALEIARHLHYVKYRDSGFVPSTQHWCFYATLCAWALIFTSLVLIVLHLAAWA